MAKWTRPTDPDATVAIAKVSGKTYHRPHWTNSGTHCVNWMFTEPRTLAQAQALGLRPCGRCYHG